MQAIAYDEYGSPDILRFVEDQKFWLAWSVESSQIELDGGHSVYNDQPAPVVDAILAIGP